MGENHRTLKEINRYCSPHSLLIIDRKGVLRRLYCPFKVRAIADVYVYKEGDTLDVIAVKVSEELLLLYIIRHKAYPYYNFRIIDQ
jgi:hypothetical protein